MSQDTEREQRSWRERRYAQRVLRMVSDEIDEQMAAIDVPQEVGHDFELGQEEGLSMARKIVNDRIGRLE